MFSLSRILPCGSRFLTPWQNTLPKYIIPNALGEGLFSRFIQVHSYNYPSLRPITFSSNTLQNFGQSQRFTHKISNTASSVFFEGSIYAKEGEPLELKQIHFLGKYKGKPLTNEVSSAFAKDSVATIDKHVPVLARYLSSLSSDCLKFGSWSQQFKETFADNMIAYSSALAKLTDGEISQISENRDLIGAFMGINVIFADIYVKELNKIALLIPKNISDKEFYSKKEVIDFNKKAEDRYYEKKSAIDKIFNFSFSLTWFKA